VKAPELHLQNEDGEASPDQPELQRWIAAALAEADFKTDAELTLRIVGEAEMKELNGRFRNIHRATNVLSFAADLPPQLQLPLLGDIVICAPLVAVEAREQGKSLAAHWAHLVVHGTLHLLGYDHVDDTEAQLMEQLETTILGKLDFAAPYEPLATNSERPAIP
jgi:probable rRNA maturation factor